MEGRLFTYIQDDFDVENYKLSIAVTESNWLAHKFKTYLNMLNTSVVAAELYRIMAKNLSKKKKKCRFSPVNLDFKYNRARGEL